MKKAFICPHCKEAAGWREETPIHRHYSAFFDKDGIFFDEYYNDFFTPSDVSHVKDTFKIVPAVLVDIREALCKECAQKEGK